MCEWNKLLFPKFFRLEIKIDQDKIGVITCLDLNYKPIK